MRSMNACKMATAVLVLTLLFSSLAMLPGNSVEGADSPYMITFNVTDSSYNPVVDAEATLEEVHTGATHIDSTDSSGLAIFSPGPGYFQLTITKSGYYDEVYPSVIRFDDLSSVNLDIIEMKEIPPMPYWLNVTVQKTGTSDLVNDVTMEIIDDGYTLMEHTYDGNLNVSVFADDLKLVLTAPGFAKEVLTHTISGNGSLTVEMNESEVIRGFVYHDGTPVTSGLTAYMISTDPGADIDYRILEPRSIGSNTFVFDSYPGEFYLVVDADDALADVSEVTVTDSATISVELLDQSLQQDDWDLDFNQEAWNAFNLTRTTICDYDETYPTMDFSYLPDLRLQIDLALGDGDGEVDQTEAEAFADQLIEFGPRYVTTHDLIQINGTSFVSDETGFSALTVDGIVGPVTSTDGFSVISNTSYEAIGSIDIGSNVYDGVFTVTTGVQHAGDAQVNRTYTINIPQGYELVENETSDVQVYGYLSIDIVVELGLSWGTEEVEMGFEASEAPSAVASLITDDFAYAVMDETELLYYIVRENKSINFTASGSFDPNGNPLQYQWDFGDGVNETASTVRTEYAYSDGAYQREVILTVVDVAGLTDQASFEVRVDGANPVAEIKVDGGQITPGSTIDADQNEALVFNGGESYDIINSTSDPEHGVIASWHWDFGDGNSTTVVLAENVTHAYEEAGTYEVTLNLTDVVGHLTSTSFYIDVKDTTAPVVSFEVLNSNFRSISQQSPMENETLYFDGSDTFDNHDPIGALTFFWEFGDGGNGTEINVSHSYTAIGTFTCKLTVTDTAGNSANKTMQITVVSSSRPDLRITSITLTPVQFVEGEQGTILVNITNVGNDNATGILGTFYRMTASGEKVLLGTSNDLSFEGQSIGLIAPDDYGILAFGWKAGSKGNYTIYVEVTSDREINKEDNHDTVSIDVNEATWKAAALYGGIFAVIVVIIVLLYFRKRLPWGASKAPTKARRGKK
jgi:PKD repeat protein